MRVALKCIAGATACLAALRSFGSADAADLGGGSLKDGNWGAPVAGVAGPCYVRADVGQSWSQDPSSHYAGAADPDMGAQSLSNGWFAETGLGCGSGSRGWRGDVTFGLREAKDFSGDYDAGPGTLGTDITSYTLMFNGYYDLGNMNGVVPYVGAGVGVAYHSMDDVVNDLGLTSKDGDKASFAWSLMAGVAYQLTQRAILDVGYRYIDLGSAGSSHRDAAGAWAPRLEVDDMRAHEFKIGLRYHFGAGLSAFK